MKLSDYIGQDKSVAIARRFMEGWKAGKPFSRALLFYGPPGVGKTSLVPCLSLHYRMPIVKYNLSRDRDPNQLRVLLNASNVQAMTGGRKLILLDECDYMTKSMEPILLELIKTTKSPLILTCNYPQKIPMAIRRSCLEVPFSRPEKEHLKEYALRIYESNPSIKASGSDLVSIVGNSRSYRQVKHWLESGAPAYDVDCYVNDNGAMTEALFQGADLAMTTNQAEKLNIWIRDNTTTPYVPEAAELVFAMHRRVGNLGHHARCLQSLAKGGDVSWPWSLRATRQKKEKPKTEVTKVETRGRGSLKLAPGHRTIDSFF